MIAMVHPDDEMTAQPGETVGYHEPVLMAETLAALAPAPGKIIVDGTLGGGGHSRALLAAGATVIGIDQDPEAIAFASARLERFGERFRAVHSSFADIGKTLDALRIGPIQGALLDIGVSSHQIDSAARGFSFMQDGPLDMRMDPAGLVSAADLVNTMGAPQLERIFRQYGEEPAARRIAAHLVRQRAVQPYTRTLQLAGSIEEVSPRRGKTHPATRVFQALRMAVNRELEALEAGLEQIARRLAPGGRFAVITFHSLEDRIVKQFFKTGTERWVDRPEWPAPKPNPARIFRKVTSKAIAASDAEQRANPRSRSAKLRAVEKIHPNAAD